MVAASPLHLATAADLARLPPDVRAEIINGEIVEKANPSAEHADAQGGALVPAPPSPGVRSIPCTVKPRSVR